LLPKIQRQQKLGKEAVFRADAAFASQSSTRPSKSDVKYAIRLPANAICSATLQSYWRGHGKAQTQAGGPVQELSLSGGPLEAGAAGGGEGTFHVGELFARVGFIVSNLATSSRAVVRFYNKRETLVGQLAAAAGQNRRTFDQAARYYWLLLAESHLTRRLFGGMLGKSRRCRRRPDTAACRAQQISVTR
jgi:hypothetical protein